jgi:hypothetical protein
MRSKWIPRRDVMKKKLGEMLYFLGLMEVHEEGGNPGAFGFLFSAFLSASRSITAPLDSVKGGYKTWFELWKKERSTEEQESLELMRDRRDSEVHDDGADLGEEMRLVPFLSHRKRGRSDPRYYGYFSAGLPSIGRVEVGEKFYKFEVDGKKVDVLPACRDFTALLDKLVADFAVAYPGA